MIIVCASWVLNLIFLAISYILLIPLFFCVIQGSVRKYVEVKIEKRLTNIISERDLMKHNDSRMLQPKYPQVEDPYFEYADVKRQSLQSLNKYQPQYQKLPPPIDTNIYLHPGPASFDQPQYMPVSPIQSERPQYYMPSPTETVGGSVLSSPDIYRNPVPYFDPSSLVNATPDRNPLLYYNQDYHDPTPKPPSKNSSRASSKKVLTAKNSTKQYKRTSSSPTPYSHFQ
eukprot:NODE_219_length_12440_cov_2.445588.p7 type:complete len:228 gc:universal NODE_219_length_12440_cov_2.445588:9217-8534(-)